MGKPDGRPMNHPDDACPLGRVFAALTLFALAGCASLQPPPPEAVNLHVLTPQPLPRSTRPQRDAVIEVALPRAWPGFDTPEMIYVERPYELDRFAVNRWADTPSRMLGPLLAQALEQTNAFRAVVQAPGVVPADFRLDTEVVRLQQNFMVRPSRVELVLRAQLTDMRGKRVVATRVFDDAEATLSDNAAGGVLAANTALQRILAQVAEFCVAQTPGR